jgi:choline kinase
VSSTLVVMAAGAGSRFGGPKQMTPIGPAGEWLLEFGLFDAHRAGFRRAVLIIRDEYADDFERRLHAVRRYLDLTFVAQRLEDLPEGTNAGTRTKPWGTGHAVLSARHAIDGPFAIINADDFYGAAAYRLAAEACPVAASTGVATVVGMRLDRTVSPHGPVKRGWCRIHGERVTGIEEVTDIACREGRLTGVGRAGHYDFSGDEIVSMNFWVFPHGVLRDLARRFDRFLAEAGRDPASEFLLPEAVNSLIADGVLHLRRVEAPGPWFGMTYREDQPAVGEGLAELVRQGVYPTPLWK